MKAYQLTGRLEGPALLALGREEAFWYFAFWQGDLKARWNLTNLCERLYNAGNRKGAGVLWNAAQYLADRAAYQREVESRGLTSGGSV